MQLKTKMTASSILLAVVPLVAACLVVGIQSYESGKEALYTEVENNLVSRRNLKKGEVENYILRIEHQVVAQANSTMFVDATKSLKLAYHNYLAEVESDAEAESKLGRYYVDEFHKVYQERNDGRQLDVQGLMGQLSPTGWALQSRYIGANPHPLGEKDTLDSFDDGSSYAQAHQAYHPGIRYFLKTFGYYDIFLVDPATGDVIYSVFKELDYATSLDTGPYRDSGLAQAYRKAKGLETGKAVFTQFEPYTPSYESAAAFVATPLAVSGSVEAILIFQMPVDEINNLMTFDGAWEDAGMGLSGETYLVDANKMILNDSRFFAEEPEAFIQLMRDTGFSDQMVANVRDKNTTIGQLPIDSPGVHAALSGWSGFEVFDDYRGVAVASAYAPVEAGGLGWVILSEVDADEAFVAIDELRATIVSSVLTFAALALLVAAGAGWWLARGVTAPVIDVSRRVAEIAKDNDFTQQVPERGDKEIKDLAISVNALVSSLRTDFGSVLQVVDSLSHSSQDVASMTGDISADVERQESECTQVATAATELQSTAAEVAQNAAHTAEETRSAGATAEQTQQTVNASAEASVNLASELAGGREILDRVAQESESIGAVLDVINGIAEQTNLLALNAAIEAARAGEQGRGFAVVADEVRQLAQRTQTATTEIEQMISSLQASSGDAVKAMERGSDMAQVSVKSAEEVAEALGALTGIISRITDMNLQVATAAEEQTSVVDEISCNVNAISDAAAENSSRAERLKATSEQLNTMSDELQGIVETYKV